MSKLVFDEPKIIAYVCSFVCKIDAAHRIRSLCVCLFLCWAAYGGTLCMCNTRANLQHESNTKARRDGNNHASYPGQNTKPVCCLGYGIHVFFSPSFLLLLSFSWQAFLKCLPNVLSLVLVLCCICFLAEQYGNGHTPWWGNG